ncbi:titin-like [Saccostrea cucullata]|uniref:titin-like n=1 Tax=Saccostrea cuccullata TaxID=36930 RepID=UPI002ED3A825
MGVCVTKTCTCVNNQVGSEDIPSLKLQKPSEDILYNGATVKIECNGIPPEIEEIQWLRYGRPLPLEHPSAVLTLSDLKTENEGAYMCEVTLKSGTKIKSDAVVLKIKDPPILELKIPPDEILIKGATVTILCQSIPKKQHKMKWFKNKKEITSTSKHSIGWLDDCPFLRLCNLESSDKGEYSCEVTHQAGFKWTSEEVMINIKDCTTEILSVHKELCFEGATLVIKCRPPIPHPNEVIWYKNNTEIVKKGRISEGTSEDPSICISKLTHHDAGIYKCRISYDFGWIEGSLKVDVEVQDTERNHANEFLDAKKSGVSGIMGTVTDFVSNLTPGKFMMVSAKIFQVLNVHMYHT